MAERTKVCDKVYIDAAGEESRYATPDTVGLEFRFTDGTTRKVELDKIGSKCKAAALWHGLSQKLGDSYAGAKGEVDAALEAFDTVLERLTGDDWVRQGEGPGTRPSMVAEAVRAALVKQGHTVSDEQYIALVEKVKGNDARKAALALPEVAAEYEALKLAAAQKRFEAKQKAAAESGGEGLASLLGGGSPA